jgi:glycosyltransferase involved in cell wall biosynthesis
MNILIITTQNPFRTSGVVAYNLYEALNDGKNDVKVLVKEHTKFESKDFISLETSYDVEVKRWKDKFERLFARFGILKKVEKTHPDYHVQDYNQAKQYYNTKRILKKIDFRPDVIFYLFQQNFLTARNLYELNQHTGAKIFWYMMDTAPLTGACHYSWDCKGYVTGCGNCPALFSDKKNDRSLKNMNYKFRFLSKTNIEIIAATEFQYRQVNESYLFRNKPIHKILLSIDPDTFSPRPIVEAKQKWGISPNKKVIFCGGTSINNKRKGMAYLIESLKLLAQDSSFDSNNILLMVAGNSDTLFQSLPYEVKHVGFLANNEQLASAYQASDVFVCPSIEDAGPMMINQSIMCGTPVVAFEMGVAFDLVITGQTGYRAKLRDWNDFAKGIKSILSADDGSAIKMKENCRTLGLELCSPLKIREAFNKLL